MTEKESLAKIFLYNHTETFSCYPLSLTYYKCVGTCVYVCDVRARTYLSMNILS